MKAANAFAHLSHVLDINSINYWSFKYKWMAGTSIKLITFWGNKCIQRGNRASTTLWFFWEKKETSVVCHSALPCFCFPTLLLSLDTTLWIMCTAKDTSYRLLPAHLLGRKGLCWAAEKWGNFSHPSPRANHVSVLDGLRRPTNAVVILCDSSVMGTSPPLASQTLLSESLCTYLRNSRLKISLPIADKWTLCGWYYPGHSVPNALCLTTKPPVKLIKLPISQLTFFLLCSVAFILLACLHTLQEMMSDQTSNAALKRFLI